ncbi:serine/threonine-protein kinase [Streptomyces platensis]|uniref:serine/threonine-protein kinase n=1 Tax=Streptomyces platensis TaxID=58346 RepID=UPI001F288C0E|nr:serine/threonine-protein kinase [Streptomyces platensis]MCF3146205.1 serine/threonine protein kinase [Streptomyces platensis]
MPGAAASGSRRGGDADLTGRVLGGRYRVTGRIGRGGMGVVCRAVDEVLGREVAVKVLRAYTDASAPELADLRTRMQREARAAARIRHSGVITVHDVIDEDGRPVIVMELVDGPSLDDVLEQQGPLEPREIARIGAQVMDALDAAHQARVLHRDVKPGNVLLDNWGHRPGRSGTGGGRVVLTDFGIASIEAPGDGATTHLTRSGELVGSLDYLPPERAQGQDPTPASDIWSLGMTLYAAVEGGGAPFRRTSVWSTLTAIVTEALPEPRRAGPLTPVLHALMAKNPADRPSAAQARDLLAAVAEGHEPTPPPVPGVPHPPTVSDVRAGGAPSAEGEHGPSPTGPANAPVPPAGWLSGRGAQGGPPTEPTPLPPSPTPTPAPTPTPPAAPVGHSAPPSAATGPYPGGSAEQDTARVPARGRRRAVPTVAAVLAVLAAGGGLTYALVGDGASETVADRGRSSARPAGTPSGPGARDAVKGTAGDGEDGKGNDAGTGKGGGKSASPSASDRPSDNGGAKDAEPGGAGGQDGGPGEGQGGSDGGGGADGGHGGASGATGGDDGSGGDEPTQGASCQSIGGGKANCDVWRGARSYTASFEQVGTLGMGTNYFYCQAKLGRRETYGKWTNVWWAKTDDDSGNSGVYISVVYLKGGENDQPVPGLPTC